MIQRIRYGYDRYSLSGIAEHLRSGHHYYIVVRIFGDRRLERRFVRLAERLAEVHAHVGKVFDDYSIILSGQLAYRLQLVFREVEPSRIVRAGIYDCSNATCRKMPFKLRAQFFAAEIIYVERVARDAENACLSTLNRESWIYEEYGVTAFHKMRTKEESRETSLHRSYRRDTSQRRDIDVEVCLQESRRIGFQFRDSIHVRVFRCDSGIQGLLFRLDAHAHRREARYAHFKMKELCAALTFESPSDGAGLSYGCTRNVKDVHLLQQGVIDLSVDR